MVVADTNEDCPEFRNGRPVRMAAWLHVKQSRFARRQTRFGKLYGEVLTFHTSESGEAVDSLDILHTHIEYTDREQKRSLRIITTRRTLTLTFASSEEAQIWAQSLRFAAEHRFEDCYRIENFMTEGTFSRIHFCRALDTSEDFIVKIIKKRSYDIQALEWVQRERHVNSVLNHNNIVQAVDMFSTQEKDYIVFEYMRGGTLADLLKKRKKLPESYARNVMHQLFTALNYIHSNNVVHRDVQPANIFCSAHKFPMSIALGDFGLANFLSEKRVNPDVLTSMVGIPPYISVDIVRRVKYGLVADMWSAGVVLYEMLSGELPFKGETDREVVEKIKAGKVEFDSPCWDEISDDAKGLVRQLLQVDPYKRISALGSLQHRWIAAHIALSRPASSTTSLPVSSAPSLSIFGDRDSPGNTSVEGRQLSGNIMPPSLSNFSRVASSTSSASQSRDISTDKVDWCERQPSSMGMGPPMHHISSISSMSALPNVQPRLKMTPSVRAITRDGLQRVHSDNPYRIRQLLGSKVVQKQLAIALPYRRKFLIVARAFVAVFRLKALMHGHSITRKLSQLGRSDVEGVTEILARRTRALEEARGSNDKLSEEEVSSGHNGLHGHVRQRSRDKVSHLMDKFVHDRKDRNVNGDVK